MKKDLDKHVRVRILNALIVRRNLQLDADLIGEITQELVEDMMDLVNRPDESCSAA